MSGTRWSKPFIGYSNPTGALFADTTCSGSDGRCLSKALHSSHAGAASAHKLHLGEGARRIHVDYS